MPFTFAHPSVILPLARYKDTFSFTALLMGSIVPDFEFFFSLREVENVGHKFHGIFLFDLPVAFVMCFVFHNFLRMLFVQNLPAYFQKRLLPFNDFNWNAYFRSNWTKVIYSLLIGIATHFACDAFTHDDGFIVERVSFFKSYVSLGQTIIPFYSFLQIVLSVIGLVFVALYFHQLPTSNDYERPENYDYWSVGLITLVSILAVRYLALPSYNTFASLIIAFIGASVYSWLFTTFLITIKNKKQNVTI